MLIPYEVLSVLVLLVKVTQQIPSDGGCTCSINLSGSNPVQQPLIDPNNRIAAVESVIHNQQQKLAGYESRLQQLEGSGNHVLRGVNYIRYGHNACPNTSTIIYDGYVAGSAYNEGGGKNYLCLPKDPEWPTGARGGYQSKAYIHGTEYEPQSSPVMPSAKSQHDAACAVCEATGKSQQLMIPGKQSCPSGWTLEYSGLLMSVHSVHKSSDFACVDKAMINVANSSTANHNGALFYVVEAKCGSLPCPPYVDGNEISCAVCTK